MRHWIRAIGGTIAIILASYALASASPKLDEAITLYQAQRYPESQTLLQQVVTAQPTNASAHYYLGQLYLQLDDYDNAIKHCKQASHLQADHAEHYFCLGRSYGEKARHGPIWKQAVLAPKIRVALEKAVSLDPYHVQARLGLTHFYMRAPTILGGSMDKAYTQALILTELSPTAGQALLDKIRSELDMITPN